MDKNSSSLEWSSHLLSENPAKGVILMAVTALLCILVWLMFEHWLYVAVAAAVLFLSTMRYYFPVRYKLDGEGVRRRYLGREKFRPWSDFRNIYIHRDGVFLAPFEKPSRLDAFRGFYLNCGAGRDQVAAYVADSIRSQNTGSTGLRENTVNGEMKPHLGNPGSGEEKLSNA